MASRLTAAEQVPYEEQEAQAQIKELEPRKEAQMTGNLTSTEKAAFGVAAIFAGTILVISVMLTIIGFIFSPVAETLVFALLAAATGTTSYAIWRGGRRNAR